MKNLQINNPTIGAQEFPLVDKAAEDIYIYDQSLSKVYVSGVALLLEESDKDTYLDTMNPWTRGFEFYQGDTILNNNTAVRCKGPWYDNGKNSSTASVAFNPWLIGGTGSNTIYPVEIPTGEFIDLEILSMKVDSDLRMFTNLMFDRSGKLVSGTTTYNTITNPDYLNKPILFKLPFVDSDENKILASTPLKLKSISTMGLLDFYTNVTLYDEDSFYKSYDRYEASEAMITEAKNSMVLTFHLTY